MKIIFLGVGCAVDEREPNTSQLIISKTNLLVDCGYTVPDQLFAYNDDPEFLDAVYISHRHADHYFGLAPLFCRLNDDGRKKAITIICQKGMKTLIEQVITLGYANALHKMTYCRFIEIETGKPLQFNEFTLDFAPTIHPVPTLALRITDGKKVYCYSADGQYTPKSERLYQKADLLVHETFRFDQSSNGHGKVTEVVEMAKRAGVKKLALTHFRRDTRRKDMKKIKAYLKREFPNSIIPEKGDSIRV